MANDQLAINAKASYDDGNLDDALAHSTLFINELRKQMVSALKLRASILEKHFKLSQELDDTLLIAHLDCNNTDAYIRCGQLYSIQGKQQQAINYFVRGLSSCPSNEQEKWIQQQITIAKARLERRIDFLIELPFEVAGKVLSYIDNFDEITTFTGVSNAWCNVILQSPEPWEYLKAESVVDPYQFYPVAVQELMLLVSRHVKTLVVGEVWAVLFYTLFKTCNFSKLKSVEIIGLSNSFDHCFGAPFYEAFGSLHMMKELNLQGDIRVHLGELLSNCSNLTSLSLCVKYIGDWRSGLPRTTVLTDIRIVLRNGRAASDDLEPLLSRTPYLRTIQLMPPTDDLTFAIENKCPELHTVYNSSRHSSIYAFSDYEMSAEPLTKPGLQRLVDEGIRSAIPIAQRIKESCDTLHELLLVPYNGGRSTRLSDWNPLSASIMSQLTYLKIKADLNSALFQHLPTMLRAYPALKALYLNGENGGTPSPELMDQFCYAITELTYLTILDIDNIRGAQCQGFNRLLQHYVDQEQPILEELKIANLKMDYGYLHNAAQIRSIRKLYIEPGYHFHFSEDELIEFGRLVGQLPHLTVLKLRRFDIPQEALDYIGLSASIQILDFENMGYVSEAIRDIGDLFAS